MRVLLQRVDHASVEIGGKIHSSIGFGLLILVGVCNEDTDDDISWMVRKIVQLRIFDDENGVMNKSVLDVGGEILVVSQFTLWASYKKGNRPSYLRAGSHEVTVPIYNRFCDVLKTEMGKDISTGVFGAEMSVKLTNNGPVTIFMDSKQKE
ncbi:MAG: D-tyrosyl-tRNA(Tyr) deacylase [Bacteroidaceae bacterium]|nr:D-tyrosyl-tRNA(Tyr) deacylase [Bacteroidaceae bacterium]